MLLLRVKEGEKGRLVCFADADFAGERHSRRSTSGWIIGLLYEDESFVALHWSCATQKVVVLSTAEAELRALTDATRGVLGSQGLFQRLMDCADGDERCHPLVYCDAQAALDAVQNGYSAKMRYSKTLQVNLAWLRNRSESGEVTFLKISSLKNLADLFTKPLPAERFQELRAAIGLQPYPPSSVPNVAAASSAEAENKRPGVQSADLFGDAAAAPLRKIRQK